MFFYSGEKTDVVFLTPSAVLLAASIIPVTGFVTSPVIPLSPPIKNPPIPPLEAPFTGYDIRPVIPLLTPWNIL